MCGKIVRRLNEDNLWHGELSYTGMPTEHIESYLKTIDILYLSIGNEMNTDHCFRMIRRVIDKIDKGKKPGWPINWRPEHDKVYSFNSVTGEITIVNNTLGEVYKQE